MGNICEKNYGIGLIILNKSINIFVLNWNGLGVVDECLSSLNKISKVNEAVKAALKCNKPAVIDVDVDPKALYSFRRDSFKHKIK